MASSAPGGRPLATACTTTAPSTRTLVRVRELTESGWSASEASRAILAGEVSLAPTARNRLRAHRPAPPRDPVQRFVEAAIDMDVIRTGAVLDKNFAQGSYESVVDEVLMPAMVALGRAWWDGRLDVAAEHAATAALLRRLSALYEAAAAPGEARVVVGLPPGARHGSGRPRLRGGRAKDRRRRGAVPRRGRAGQQLGPGHAADPSSPGRHRRRDPRGPAGCPGGGANPAGRAPETVVALGGQWADWDEGVEAGVIVLPARINDAAGLAARLALGAPVSERSPE